MQNMPGSLTGLTAPCFVWSSLLSLLTVLLSLFTTGKQQLLLLPLTTIVTSEQSHIHLQFTTAVTSLTLRFNHCINRKQVILCFPFSTAYNFPSAFYFNFTFLISRFQCHDHNKILSEWFRVDFHFWSYRVRLSELPKRIIHKRCVTQFYIFEHANY